MTADSVGGVWRYGLDVSAELVRRGVTVTLAGLGPLPSRGQVQEADAAAVDLVWLDVPLDWADPKGEALAQGAAALNDLLSERRPDLLHLNTPSLASLLEGRPPCLAAAHSCLATWWRAMRSEALPADWQRHAQDMASGLAAADVVTAPTAAFAAQLRAAYSQLPPVQVVPNGGRTIEAQAKGQFVLAAGRWWDESKNLWALEAAAREVAWPVHAAGPLAGPETAVAAPDHLSCLGSLDYRELTRWFAMAPIFVSPARYEPFGLAVLEAASAGAALVLSDIATFRELWDDCAVFVDPLQPEAMARSINALIEDEKSRALLGARAQRRAASFTVPRQVDALLTAYHRAAETRFQTV
ncbi:glycosyltransferase family 4 protein [Aquibaculum arenosum]|uniref:Glycosyltransferase family 4 protein n=1 Tax=Aquibaculum arenosum TaxID=3032591 RepID=A0ABT5YK87_9PROT|nr:glycosyltransferase family 4 protein [Fodinicurvata sp. CAU 1616]MDF2095357.1 glycosyltransferase family 4 protein [Fodinicurvata sp. CAU 1616]